MNTPISQAGECLAGILWVVKEPCFSLCLDKITQYLVSLDHGLRGSLSEASAVCACMYPTENMAKL